VLFEPLDAFGQGRLGQVNGPAGPSEVFLFLQSKKMYQLIDLHDDNYIS
jgi:hypothetical protein